MKPTKEEIEQALEVINDSGDDIRVFIKRKKEFETIKLCLEIQLNNISQSKIPTAGKINIKSINKYKKEYMPPPSPNPKRSK